MSLKLYHGMNQITAGRRVETVAEMLGVKV